MAKTFQLPTNRIIENQAKLVLKGVGMSLLKPKLFKLDVKKASTESITYEGNAGSEGYDKKSWLGTLVYDIVKIQSHSYEDDSGQTINNAAFDLELAIVEITKPRNIVKTKVAGKNGTIKEFMSDDDYQISIKGSFSSQNSNMSPSDLIRNFNQVTKSPIALNVESNFLAFFDIFTLVIEDSKISQREGARNIVDYELVCSSDTPFEIRSEEENNDGTPSF